MSNANLLLAEILGALATLGTIGNIVLYIGGFFRRLENEVQEEAQRQNSRITYLEGQVNTLLSKKP